jgi:hypothetical protein
MSKLFHSKIARALGLLVLVFLAGVLGFKCLFDYGWIDAI